MVIMMDPNEHVDETEVQSCGENTFNFNQTASFQNPDEKNDNLKQSIEQKNLSK